MTIPAARRLRRIRWAMTLVFAAVTAACLVVLAAIAITTDSSSRRYQVDIDLGQTAGELSRTVYFDDLGRLRLDRLENDVLANSAHAFGVVANGSIEIASPDQAALPKDAALRTMIASATRQNAIVHVAAASADGENLEWAVAPVPDGTDPGAFVLVGGLMLGAGGHDRLVVGLFVGIAALVLVAAIAGYLLSGRAMRPALRGLEQQEQFLVEAAHELRTPLATLRLIVDAEHPGGRAGAQVDRMSAILSGLLTRARAESGAASIEFESLRLDQLVEVAVSELEGADRVDLTTRQSVVRGNPELLAQAVRNLVENALRYGGDSMVRVDVADGVISVEDAGDGIPADQRERVLRRGVGSGEGTGTGLAIVAWVAEVHSGRLELADATSGRGLLARLILPS